MDLREKRVLIWILSLFLPGFILLFSGLLFRNFLLNVTLNALLVMLGLGALLIIGGTILAMVYVALHER